MIRHYNAYDGPQSNGQSFGQFVAIVAILALFGSPLLGGPVLIFAIIYFYWIERKPEITWTSPWIDHPDPSPQVSPWIDDEIDGDQARTYGNRHRDKA